MSASPPTKYFSVFKADHYPCSGHVLWMYSCFCLSLSSHKPKNPPTMVLCICRCNKTPTKLLQEWKKMFWLMASQSTATWYCVIVENTVTKECGQGNHSLSYEYETRTRIQEGISQGHTPGIYFFQRFPPLTLHHLPRISVCHESLNDRPSQYVRALKT